MYLDFWQVLATFEIPGKVEQSLEFDSARREQKVGNVVTDHAQVVLEKVFRRILLLEVHVPGVHAENDVRHVVLDLGGDAVHCLESLPVDIADEEEQDVLATRREILVMRIPKLDYIRVRVQEEPRVELFFEGVVAIETGCQDQNCRQEHHDPGWSLCQEIAVFSNEIKAFAAHFGDFHFKTRAVVVVLFVLDARKECVAVVKFSPLINDKPSGKPGDLIEVHRQDAQATEHTKRPQSRHSLKSMIF